MALAALGAGAALATGCGEDTGAATATAARDCGTIVVRTPTRSMPCFDAAFARCAPASVLIDNSRAPILTSVKVRYTIRGRSGADCRVTWSYVALPPNPSWEGKDIDCPYRAGPNWLAAFDAAPQDMAGCRGPLMNLIRS